MSDEMTPWERVFAVIDGKEFDRYPAINPTSVATVSSMNIARAHFPEAHYRAREIAHLAAVGHDHFGFDSVAPYYSVHLEASALGAEIDWGDDYRTPRVIHNALDQMDDLNLSEHFLNKKPFQSLLSAISMLAEKYDHTVPVIGKVIGPWTLAYHLYGVDKLMLDMILEPQKTKQFITELSRVPIAFAKAQFDAGADMVTWAEHCTSDLVSAEIYRDVLLPIHKRAANELQKGGPLILHICGNIMDRLGSITETGIKILHIDSRNDISKAREIAENKITLVGCINNPFTLAQSKPNHVRKEVNFNISSGIQLIAPECAIPRNVPDANLFALVSETHKHRMM